MRICKCTSQTEHQAQRTTQQQAHRVQGISGAVPAVSDYALEQLFLGNSA